MARWNEKPPAERLSERVRICLTAAEADDLHREALREKLPTSQHIRKRLGLPVVTTRIRARKALTE